MTGRGVRESGVEEIRTPDLSIANRTLYQLSYHPIEPVPKDRIPGRGS